MFETFFDTYSGNELIFEWVGTETERRIVIQDFVEEDSGLFDFKGIGSVHSSLIDSASQIRVLFGLAFTTGDEDVKGEDIIDSELLRVDMLIEGLFVEDHFVAINQMFL